MRKAIATALFLMPFAMPALAGVTLTQTLQELDGGKPAGTNLIRLDADKARIDMDRNPDLYMIYRADKNAFWMVDVKGKTFTEMTDKDLDSMRAKMDAAMAKLREQMKGMPPERQRMMEEMMAKMSPGGAQGPRTVYRKIGDGGKVQGWPTEKYEGRRDSAKVSEIWTTAPKNVGVREADVKVLMDMGKFFQKFAKGLPDLVGNRENGLEGVPVKSIGYRDGKPHWQSELKSVKKEDLAASLFEVPAGFARKEFGKQE
jgi:hypothetical protein